jgi:haloacetate dehalogenase
MLRPVPGCLGREVFFEGLEEWNWPVGDDVTLHGRAGGIGPAVVLLHGHPRAHTTWHRVAPRLVEAGFFVVCPDLRGYGRSAKPEPQPDHGTYCDRTMAADVVAVMSDLGRDRFSVVGHDRGQGVASRCALDHPDRVESLTILDGVPILEAVERVDARFAAEWWHWFFFARSPHAERVITADPDAWYGLDDEKRHLMGPENFDYVAEALRDPSTVRAMLEDYRAGLSIDLEHAREDREASRRVRCPTLIGWSLRDDMEDLYGDPSRLWEYWVDAPLSTARIDSGHHVAEENPRELTAALLEFLPRSVLAQ